MPKSSTLAEETKVDNKASSNRSKRQNRFCPNKETIEVKKVRTNPDSNSATEKAFADQSSSEESDSGDEKSQSWTYIKSEYIEPEKLPYKDILKGASKKEIIKFYYLVDMPNDFYSFFDFCQSISEDEPLSVMNQYGLTLVGPFDILAGKEVNVENKELMLCHWRHFYDPPEFLTVLTSESKFHIGYWRDEPKEMPVFVASNNPSQSYIFKIEGENLFGGVHNYLIQYMKTCDPFSKSEAAKFLASLSKWAKDNKFTLDKSTNKIKARQSKIISKTFHGAGMVVPVDWETGINCRRLPKDVDEKLKKLCKQIINADKENEREWLMEKLDPLLTFARLRNDEGSYGHGLELGINLFCMGSPVFDSNVKDLLETAYSLLGRPEFREIIRAHLKRRKNEANLSVL